LTRRSDEDIGTVVICPSGRRLTCPSADTNVFRYGQARFGHPRLLSSERGKTWMPGSSPGMTSGCDFVIGNPLDSIYPTS
jgi:hypothetical protein